MGPLCDQGATRGTGSASVRGFAGEETKLAMKQYFWAKSAEALSRECQALGLITRKSDVTNLKEVEGSIRESDFRFGREIRRSLVHWIISRDLDLSRHP